MIKSKKRKNFISLIKENIMKSFQNKVKFQKKPIMNALLSKNEIKKLQKNINLKVTKNYLISIYNNKIRNKLFDHKETV